MSIRHFGDIPRPERLVDRLHISVVVYCPVDAYFLHRSIINFSLTHPLSNMDVTLQSIVASCNLNYMSNVNRFWLMYCPPTAVVRHFSPDIVHIHNFCVLACFHCYIDAYNYFYLVHTCYLFQVGHFSFEVRFISLV